MGAEDLQAARGMIADMIEGVRQAPPPPSVQSAELPPRYLVIETRLRRGDLSRLDYIVARAWTGEHPTAPTETHYQPFRIGEDKWTAHKSAAEALAGKLGGRNITVANLRRPYGGLTLWITEVP